MSAVCESGYYRTKIWEPFFSNIKKRKFVIILNVKCNLYFNCGLFGFFLGAAYTQVFTVVVVFGKDQLVGVATFGTFYCL